MKPEPILIRHEYWEQFAEDQTEAAYEKIDNYIDKLRFKDEIEKLLNVALDIVAGGFEDGKNVYFDEAVWNGPDIDFLSEHELGHVWMGYNHPTTLLKGTIHAYKCNCDTRAFTRILRKRRNKVIAEDAIKWLKHWKAEYAAGRLKARKP